MINKIIKWKVVSKAANLRKQKLIYWSTKTSVHYPSVTNAVIGLSMSEMYTISQYFCEHALVVVKCSSVSEFSMLFGTYQKECEINRFLATPLFSANGTDDINSE